MHLFQEILNCLFSEGNEIKRRRIFIANFILYTDFYVIKTFIYNKIYF